MTRKTRRLAIVFSLLAVGLVVSYFAYSSTEDMRREAAYRSAARKIQRDDMRFFENKKRVRIDYETESNWIALDLVRCVEVDDQLVFPVMLSKYSAYSGFLGGVESFTGFARIVDSCSLDKKFPDQLQFPLDPGIRKHVLFLKEIVVGKGELPGTEWAYFEVADPLGVSIRIPNVKNLPLAKHNKSYQAFISKVDEVDRELDAVLPDR